MCHHVVALGRLGESSQQWHSGTAVQLALLPLVETDFVDQSGVSHRVPWKQGALGLVKRLF